MWHWPLTPRDATANDSTGSHEHHFCAWNTAGQSVCCRCGQVWVGTWRN